MADYAGGFRDLGGAVTSLFGSRGASAAATSYDEAQRIANENADLEESSTRVKALLLQRQITKSLGTTQAQVGGAGFASSGSALDIMRDSASRGAMTKALNEEQGAITANSYREQANQFGGMATAARSSATAGTISGLLNLTGAGMSIFGGGSGGAAAGSAGGDAAGTAGAGDLIEGAAVLA